MAYIFTSEPNRGTRNLSASNRVLPSSVRSQRYSAKPTSAASATTMGALRVSVPLIASNSRVGAGSDTRKRE